MLQDIKIKSIKPIGKFKTYDLKVEDNHNFFLGNNILTHNSGKDRSMDFLEMISNKLNEAFKDTSEYERLLTEDETPDKLIRVYNASGSETMETYLDSLEVDNKGIVGNIIPGILSTCDLLILRECSFLFSGQGNEGRQSKREIFLQSMEGRPVIKSLIKWKGHTTETLCEACIVGGTRPIANMKEHMANTGLQQRALNYMRNVDLDMRKKMLSKVSEKSMTTSEELIVLEDKYAELAKKLLAFREFYKKSDFSFKDRKALSKLINDRMLLMFERIEKDLSFHPEKKDIMHTFMGRFIGLVNVISVFNAAIRNEEVVAEIDVDRALSHIENNFNSIIDWVDETIASDKDEERKLDKWTATITKIFEKDTFVYRKELVDRLALIMHCSKPTVYRKLAQFKGMFEEGNNGILNLVK